MNTNQKLALLIADYAVRIITVNRFVELPELPAIRSMRIAGDVAYAIRNVIYTKSPPFRFTVDYYMRYAALTAANSASYAFSAVDSKR